MSVSPVFHSLFDDAALFPPGDASMPEAVTDHLGRGLDQRPGRAELTGRFVCPAARLAELDAELARQSGGPIMLSMTVPAGLAELDQAVANARTLTRIELQAIELPVSKAELNLARRRLTALVRDGLDVFIEVPVDQVDAALTATLAGAELGVKLRTGGTSPAAFPTAAELGRALTAVASSTAPAKCTAGLHHPVAHTDPVTGFAHHGFINVLLAIQAARHRMDPIAVLAEQDPTALTSSLATLTDTEVPGLRGQFRSIGSCSISEPLTDLENLGLVIPA